MSVLRRMRADISSNFKVYDSFGEVHPWAPRFPPWSISSICRCRCRCEIIREVLFFVPANNRALD